MCIRDSSYISFIDEIQQIRSVNSIGSLKLNKLTNAENVNNFKGNYLGLANANIEFTHVLKAAKDTAAIKVSMNGKDTVVVHDMSFIIDEINLSNCLLYTSRCV